MLINIKAPVGYPIGALLYVLKHVIARSVATWQSHRTCGYAEIATLRS